MANIRVLATDLEFPEGPVVMPDGSVVLVEIRGQRLTRVWPDGRKEVVAKIPGGPNGAALGPDGKIYICNNGGFSWIPTRNMIMPGPQPDDYQGGSIQRIDLQSGKVEPSSPGAANTVCAVRTTSCSTSMAACGSPNLASAATAKWMSAACITSSPA